MPTYYLAKAGHEVEVIDRQPGPALETSFANAGELSFGYTSPWAAPGIPLKALRWLMMEHAPLIMRPRLDLRMAAWVFQMLRNCTAERYGVNKGRMVRISDFSRVSFAELRAATGIKYDERTLGTLQLFRSAKQIDSAAKDMDILAKYGVPYALLDRVGCEAFEPGLKHSTSQIVGGLRTPEDETGDCHLFTTKLAGIASDLGVAFRYGVAIEGLDADGDRITSVVTSAGRVKADAYVTALGSFSPLLTRTVGADIPIYPIKGYSITVPIRDLGRAPQSTLLDESFKVAITRLGDRIRIGGMAEISGFSTDLPQRRRKTLAYCVNDLFPGAGDIEASSYWSGLRPMTPDGTPVIGRLKYGNLYVNSGHGTLGWTMSCGSARALAGLITGTDPGIELSDLGPQRYWSR